MDRTIQVDLVNVIIRRRIFLELLKLLLRLEDRMDAQNGINQQRDNHYGNEHKEKCFHK